MSFDKENAKEVLVLHCYVREKFKAKQIAEYVGIEERRVNRIIDKYLKTKTVK